MSSAADPTVSGILILVNTETTPEETMTQASDTTIVNSFKRHVDVAAGIYYRQDSGRLTGRNSESTDQWLAHNVRAAQQMLRDALQSDDTTLFDYLDAHPRYAAKWDRIERRFVGLSPVQS